MRSIWSAVSVVCFLNVVAALLLIGWLAQSGKLTPERVAEIRLALTESETDRAARLEAEATEPVPGPDSANSEIVEVAANDLLASGQQVQRRLRESDADIQRVHRLEREINDLRSALTRERGVIDRERESFEQDKLAFEAMREQIAKLEGTEQFQKALIVYESIKPADAMAALLQLVQAGDSDEAVGYLDAMESRKRSKIVSELIKAGEVPLAVKLLEAIRTRGIESADLGASSL